MKDKLSLKYTLQSQGYFFSSVFLTYLNNLFSRRVSVTRPDILPVLLQISTNTASSEAEAACLKQWNYEQSGEGPMGGLGTASPRMSLGKLHQVDSWGWGAKKSNTEPPFPHPWPKYFLVCRLRLRIVQNHYCHMWKSKCSQSESKA